MAKVTSSADRSKRAARSKAKVSGKTPSSRANRSAVSKAKVTTNTSKPASAQATDARKFQALNQSASAKAGKVAEPKPRTPAPGTGNVLQSAINRSKSLKDSARQANRQRVAASDAAKGKARKGLAAAAAGEVASKVLGPAAKKAGSALANRVLIPAARKLDDARPGINSKDEGRRRAAAATAKSAGTKGPSVPKRLTQNGMDKGSFNSAFKASRAAGKKTFSWKGKKYTTKKAGE
jgi:hypothetical protein